MATQNYYKDVQHVVHISTNISQPCEHCQMQLGLDEFDAAINHYIDKHDYKLLHVGTETSHDMDGKPWHSTVALVGR